MDHLERFSLCSATRASMRSWSTRTCFAVASKFSTSGSGRTSRSRYNLTRSAANPGRQRRGPMDRARPDSVRKGSTTARRRGRSEVAPKVSARLARASHRPKGYRTPPRPSPRVGRPLLVDRSGCRGGAHQSVLPPALGISRAVAAEHRADVEAGLVRDVVLADPELVDQGSLYGVVLVVADAAGDEVDCARDNQIDERGLVGDLPVGFRPQGARIGRTRGLCG
jgi:hypothetical protein